MKTHFQGKQRWPAFALVLVVADWLDGKHTVFGEVTKGQDVVNAIRGGDKIKSIDILDSTDDLFAAQAANLTKWNGVLDR